MQKWPFWPILSHILGQICHCGSFPAALVWKNLKKMENSKKLLMYPPPEMRIFEISPKMRCFGGKRWEKLWIRWNWLFWVNLSLILGEKIEKYAKMAVLTQSKPLFWPNLPLWVIPSSIGVKPFEKVGKLKKFANVPPPEMKIFEISPKMRCFGGKRWGKLWIRWNWPFRVNLSLILREKIEKYAKMALWTQSKPLFWPNLPLWVISSHIGVKPFEKVGKLKKLADVPPPRNENFEISPKMRCFGGKRWEKLWIRWNWPFRVISASFWGKR